MNIACADETVVPAVRAVLQQYQVSPVRQQGPNLGSPMIWVMVGNITLKEDTERAMRREIAQIAGAVIH
jgi:hypothetical protein